VVKNIKDELGDLVGNHRAAAQLNIKLMIVGFTAESFNYGMPIEMMYFRLIFNPGIPSQN
jgi:hypothetical protein